METMSFEATAAGEVSGKQESPLSGERKNKLREVAYASHLQERLLKITSIKSDFLRSFILCVSRTTYLCHGTGENDSTRVAIAFIEMNLHEKRWRTTPQLYGSMQSFKQHCTRPKGTEVRSHGLHIPRPLLSAISTFGGIIKPYLIVFNELGWRLAP
ncbi:hypothetical protein C0J52_16244 [Blattella germanica]|nr:hypothetical protein C0J52_16244 [Blattella germanica]